MDNQSDAPKGGSWITGGYEPRYIVRRADGKPIRSSARYFVLQFNGEDPHAIDALIKYSSSVAQTNPRLAKDIAEMLLDPANAHPQHE